MMIDVLIITNCSHAEENSIHYPIPTFDIQRDQLLLCAVLITRRWLYGALLQATRVVAEKIWTTAWIPIYSLF